MDELWDCFCTILLQGIDCFVPTTTGVTSLKVHHSRGVKKLMSKRKTFWRLKKSSPTNFNVHTYNTATVALNAALLDEATSKELKIIKSGNIGQFYKHVNSRLHHKSGIAPLTKTDGTIYICDSEKSEMFSVYFANVGIIDDGHLPASRDCLSNITDGINSCNYTEHNNCTNTCSNN